MWREMCFSNNILHDNETLCSMLPAAGELGLTPVGRCLCLAWFLRSVPCYK